MALDDKIYELRREKLKQIEALGQQSYPRKYEFTHTLPEILASYSNTPPSSWRIRASMCAWPGASWPFA